MTVYRRFGDKRRLMQAVAVRETRRSLARVAAALEPTRTVEERFAEGFVATLRVAREHPLLARADPAVLLRSLNDPGDRTGELMCDFLAGMIREGQRAGEMREVDAHAAAELLYRIGISFALLPATVLDLEDEETLRNVARNLLAPMLAAG